MSLEKRARKDPKEKRETWERRVSRVHKGRLDQEETEGLSDAMEIQEIGATQATKVSGVHLGHQASVDHR